MNGAIVAPSQQSGHSKRGKNVTTRLPMSKKAIQKAGFGPAMHWTSSKTAHSYRRQGISNWHATFMAPDRHWVTITDEIVLALGNKMG